MMSSSSSTPSLSPSATPEIVNIPRTQHSVLFDDDMVEKALDLDRSIYPLIMVIGGLGYIGSHTVLELLKEGYNVLVIDNLSNSYKSVLGRLQTLAVESCTAEGKRMPILHFRELDYRSARMKAVLATYSSDSITSKPATTPGHFPYLSCKRTSSEIKMSTDDRKELVIERRSRISGVIHFAAYKSVEESIRAPLKYYSNNVCGLVEFLGLLEEFGIKNLVFSSSATVYGEGVSCGIPLREELCVHQRESFVDIDGIQRQALPGVLGLTSPYGRSKFMCESILADLALSDPTWAITALRYFNPIGCHESGTLGEDPRQKPSNLIPAIATVLMGDAPELNIYGTDWNTSDGTAVRDFIHVVDLARGHVAALAASATGRTLAPFRTYNLGTGRGHTVREVLQSLEEASRRKIPVRAVGRRAGDVGFCVAEVQRAEVELQWKAEKTIDDCSVDVWNFTKVHCPDL